MGNVYEYVPFCEATASPLSADGVLGALVKASPLYAERGAAELTRGCTTVARIAMAAALEALPRLGRRHGALVMPNVIDRRSYELPDFFGLETPPGLNLAQAQAQARPRRGLSRSATAARTRQVSARSRSAM